MLWLIFIRVIWLIFIGVLWLIFIGVEYQLGHRPVFFSGCRYYSVQVTNFNKVKVSREMLASQEKRMVQDMQLVTCMFSITYSCIPPKLQHNHLLANLPNRQT